MEGWQPVVGVMLTLPEMLGFSAAFSAIPGSVSKLSEEATMIEHT
jgi:hypothetical protein